MIILIIFLISTNQIPVEYKGWMNNCSLYFQSSAANKQLAFQQFIQCHTHICEEYYLMSCDKYVLEKKYSLEECMRLCCNQQSEYRQFTEVLDFLSACQLDFLKKKNKAATTTNRLPFKILFYTLIGFTILIIICVAIAYSDEIMEWGRDRLAQRDRNDAGIQLRNFLN